VFQWSQWFSGHEQSDEPVGEQAIEDGLRPGWLRQDHAAKRVGLPFRIGDRIARREDPKTAPGLTPPQTRRVYGGVL
jgi:hypothetical protein